jgi:hypothetical protein
LPSPCCTLWIGPALGRVERACVRSVVSQGHRLTLYSYGRVAGVPEGVEARDAAEILPQSRVFRHRQGSPAPFADLFRYELQRRGMGTWVDCDLYLLRPIPDRPACLMGRQDEDGTISNAVLRLPPDSPLLPPLIALFDERRVPPWLSPASKVAAYLRLLLEGRTRVDRMPWGTTGPHALTALARRLGLSDLAQRPEIFFPMPWQKAAWIADRQCPLEAVVQRNTIGVHLYNECIRDLKDRPARAGSFLARLQAEGA